ncbi:MAG: hypothetical protein OEY56_14720, partial [Cyclobacteriaceae bacterium]|nr:hypothetical protein [Cyclobacteriaceae bacterium]
MKPIFLPSDRQMLHDAFLSPASIAVIGGSGHTDKPGGRLLLNLLDGRFQGSLVAVNPRWQPAPATNLTVCSTIREINTS